MKNKITIRISDDLRDQIDKMAQLEDVSTSELTRTILYDYCNSENVFEGEKFVENEPQNDEVIQSIIDYEEEYYYVICELERLYKENEEYADVVYSVEFLQLVSWVYYQRSAEIIVLLDEEYKGFQNTIIKIHSSKILSLALKNEFNKVFADLVKVDDDIFLKNSQLDFSKGMSPKFNYSLLSDFIFKNNCGVRNINL